MEAIFLPFAFPFDASFFIQNVLSIPMKVAFLKGTNLFIIHARARVTSQFNGHVNTSINQQFKFQSWINWIQREGMKHKILKWASIQHRIVKVPPTPKWVKQKKLHRRSKWLAPKTIKNWFRFFLCGHKTAAILGLWRLSTRLESFMISFFFFDASGNNEDIFIYIFPHVISVGLNPRSVAMATDGLVAKPPLKCLLGYLFICLVAMNRCLLIYCWNLWRFALNDIYSDWFNLFYRSLCAGKFRISNTGEFYQFDQAQTIESGSKILLFHDGLFFRVETNPVDWTWCLNKHFGKYFGLVYIKLDKMGSEMYFNDELFFQI